MKWDYTSEALNRIFNVDGRLFTIVNIASDTKFVLFLDQKSHRYSVTESVVKSLTFSDFENNERIRDMSFAFFQNTAERFITETLKIYREQILSFECSKILDQHSFDNRVLIKVVVLTLPSIIKRPPIQEIMDV